MHSGNSETAESHPRGLLSLLSTYNAQLPPGLAAFYTHHMCYRTRLVLQGLKNSGDWAARGDILRRAPATLNKPSLLVADRTAASSRSSHLFSGKASRSRQISDKSHVQYWQWHQVRGDPKWEPTSTWLALLHRWVSWTLKLSVSCTQSQISAR